MVREEALLQDDATHLYNPYIEALEQLRTVVSIDESEFYLALLGTPIKDRPGYALGLRAGLPPERRSFYVAAYAKARRVLEEDEDIKWLTAATRP
jgi:hypothetical protein